MELLFWLVTPGSVSCFIKWYCVGWGISCIVPAFCVSVIKTQDIRDVSEYLSYIVEPFYIGEVLI